MILQLSKKPPPIGGVTIHVQRLMAAIKIQGELQTELLDYSKEKNLRRIFKKIINSNIIHVHLTHKQYRLILTVILRLLFKKVIITFHGKYDFSNQFDYLSLKLSNKAIVLNQFSYDKAIKKSNNVSVIGAFIPPIEKQNTNTLDPVTLNSITDLKKKYKHIFATNAYNIVFDNKGDEIYGGSLLIEVFKKLHEEALIFSDPTGKYKEYLLNKYGALPKNIFFINYFHNYIEVIKAVDCTIRATTTDGDALSVKESLYYKTDVICSTVVDRPKGCILYTGKNQLLDRIHNFSRYKGQYLNYIYENNVEKIIHEYYRL